MFTITRFHSSPWLRRRTSTTSSSAAVFLVALSLHACMRRILPSQLPSLKLAPTTLIILLSCLLSSILHCTAHPFSTATSLLHSLSSRVARFPTGAVVYVSRSNHAQKVSRRHQEANYTLQSPAAVPSTMVPGHAATPLTSTHGAKKLETPVGPTVVYSHISKDPSTGTTTRATPLSMASQAPYTLPLAVETMPSASPSRRLFCPLASSLTQT